MILNQKHIKDMSKMQLLQCTVLHRILSEVHKISLIWFNIPQIYKRKFTAAKLLEWY
jgi:hypothetical protein